RFVTIPTTQRSWPTGTLRGLRGIWTTRARRVPKLWRSILPAKICASSLTAPTLILNPTDDMKVMQEEIFGPLLPVKAYQKVDDAIDYINAHDRPLGLYYFGADNAERDRVLNQTTSGGVSVNDVVMHVAQEELPFGGIGPAGMGAYHGYDGFREFSHRKSVFHQMKRDIGPLRMLRPPYGAGIAKYLTTQIKR